MSEREDTMRAQGVWTCPTWCEQPEDEHQYEEHFGPWVSFENSDSEHVVVRKRLKWHDDAAARLELTVRGEGGTVNLTLHEMNQMVMDLLYGEEREVENYETKPAYENAEGDEWDAEYGDFYEDEDDELDEDDDED